MATLEELLGKAKAAPPRYSDVEVSLDAGVAQRINELEAELAGIEEGFGFQLQGLHTELAELEKDARLSDPRRKKIAAKIEQVKAESVDSPERAKVLAKLDELHAEAAASLVTLRFTALAGERWAYLTASSPRRPDVTIDLGYGYNYHQVCKQAALETASRVEGETVTPIPAGTVEELLSVVSGNDFERIMSVVFDVNAWSSSQDLGAAKKASTATSATG